MLVAAVMAALAGGSLGASCGQSGLSLMPGVVNNPANRSLRRAVFRFAIDQLCSEMRMRSVPLNLRDEDPATGRFFPTACSVQELDNENLFVQFLGHGYAWTNVTHRMGFEASAAVEYEHDFLMEGSTMYVYFRQKQTQSSAFRALMVERGEGGAAGTAASLLGTNVQAASQQIGDRVLAHQLARGFTVVRDDDGAVSFSLGVLERGARPLQPFGKGSSDWLVLANERSELHSGQRDYAGPFSIDSADQALYLTVALEGSPAVDVLVVPKAVGESWASQYERYPHTGPPPQPAIFEDTVTALGAVVGAPATAYRKKLPLPVGTYFIVFDHSATAGKTAPPGTALDDRAALVSYAVQLGDAD
ncbi:MAG: hypothetical protein KKI08_02955 [Armatimonadetes bacterium]|nr:hypothetical protein [Armatimonadota bacterium]